MKIVTLIENLTYKKNLVAEHGLSIYIETANKKILFDTGQSENFIKNAKHLGVDIDEISDLVISHGHYDHTGGMLQFIDINKSAKIHIKESAFNKKFKGELEYIGIPYNTNIFEEQINYISKTTQIDDDLFIVPETEIFHPDNTNFENMKIMNKYTFSNDEFNDEQFLVINNKKELSIITGCSHRGIINIVKSVQKESSLPINYIVGGFHLHNSSEEKIQKTIDYFKTINFKKIALSHCSGVYPFAKFKEEFGDKVFYNYTGVEFEI